MKTIEIKTYGKINLFLDVIGRRPDNYHELNMIMQEIDLYDTLYIEELEEDTIKIDSNEKTLPKNRGNIVYKAIELIKNKYDIRRGIKVYIQKNIPISAGLAGGSTNCGGVIRGLNQIWNLNLNLEEQMALGGILGSDVPFFFLGGSAIAGGRGTKLKKINDLKDVNILLINPNLEISTKEVYDNLSIEPPYDIKPMLKGIELKDIELISSELKNKLEKVVFKKYPIVKELKLELIKQKAVGSLMSGSGSTVFGIFKTEKDMELAKIKILDKYKDFKVISVKTR